MVLKQLGNIRTNQFSIKDITPGEPFKSISLGSEYFSYTEPAYASGPSTLRIVFITTKEFYNSRSGKVSIDSLNVLQLQLVLSKFVKPSPTKILST